jgi:hypothetical protein
MTNKTSPALLAAARAAIAERGSYAALPVTLNDGTAGIAGALRILVAARTESQDVAVRQGGRVDIWFPSQLAPVAP